MITILKNINKFLKKAYLKKRTGVLNTPLSTGVINTSFNAPASTLLSNHEKLSKIFTKCYKVYNNTIVKCKNIGNCITKPMFGAKPQTGLPINSVEGFAVLNSLGLGTDLLPCCYTKINKKDNSIFNQLKNKRFTTSGCVNICKTKLMT